MSDSLISGLLGMAVALITWWLAGYRERMNKRSERQLEHVRRVEALYAEALERLEMAIRYTQQLKSYDELQRELSSTNAKMSLIASYEVKDQDDKVSELLAEWSAKYRKGSAKPIGDAGCVVVSSQDGKFMEAANCLYPELQKEISILVDRMKNHLEQLRNAA